MLPLYQSRMSRQATTWPATTMAGVGGGVEARNSPTAPRVVMVMLWLGRVALEMKVRGSAGSRPPAIKARAISGALLTAIYMTMTGEAVANACQSTLAGMRPLAS